MKAFFLLLVSIAALGGCANNNVDPSYTDNSILNQTTTQTDSGKYSYLALGDSYTIGEAVSLSNSFPYQLKSQLLSGGISVKDPKIIAVTGWTTANLIAAIANENITQKYDFVTLLIGVNNQYQRRSQTEYRTQFVQLLNTAIGFANGNKLRVFVLSIPDYSVTPFAATSDRVQIATEIDQFNAINKEESTKAGVNYLDITPISRQASADATLIAPDGLHPSAKMYNLWVNQLSPMVKAQLK
jgi:lysophospholipase L1-like esterase